MCCYQSWVYKRFLWEPPKSLKFMVFLCFVDLSPRYNRVEKTLILHSLFRASLQLFQNNYQQDDTFGLSFISGLIVLHSTCFELQRAHHQEFTFLLYRQPLAYCVHVLLYQIAAFVLYSFLLMFLYWYTSLACLALINFTFIVPCIIIIVPK